MRILAAASSAPAREKFTIAIGVPVTIALQYTSGKRVPSRIPGAPDQIFYTLADGRPAYLPLGVGQLIDELHLAPREPFVLRKNSSDDWDVERVHTPAPRPPQSADIYQAHKTYQAQAAPSGPAPAFLAIPTTVPPTANAPVNGAGQTCRDIYEQCSRDAVDLALGTMAYAKQQGLPIGSPSFEDLRCATTALFIAITKSGGAR